MSTGSASWQRALGTALIAVPILSLGTQALMWLRYSIDLPFYDDFRSYELWSAQSLALKDLFRPANDTLYPVGMALDALAHRYLAGNTIAYQLFSMLAVLGGLLWIQWRLLTYALPDRLSSAAAFALCVFAIQPATYLGFQDMAYHQGLPVVLLLAALAVILLARWSRWLSLAVVLCLGLLAGFTYISGAAATLVMALTLMVLAPMRPVSQDERRAGTLTLRDGAMALLGVALVTVPAQAWVILGHQKGLHMPGGAFAFPWDSSYWVYLFAKVARALTLPGTHPFLSLTLAAALTALALALAALLLRKMAANRSLDPAPARVTTVFVVLLAMVAGYLAMLAGGRANLYATHQDVAEVFQVGHSFRMHFFWVTLLPPWFAAAALVALNTRTSARLLPRVTLPALTCLIIIGAAAGGAFAHGRHFRDLMDERLVTQVACLREKLAGLGEEMLCPGLYPADLSAAYVHALITGASFTRIFPLQPVPLGAATEPLFRWSRAAPGAISLVNIDPTAPPADGVPLQPTSGDPILSLTLSSGTLKDCLVVDVTMRIETAKDDIAQLFLLRPDQPGFADPATATVALSARAAGLGEITLRGMSPNGFQDLVRIDPVSTQQPFKLKEMEVRCRVRHKFAWLRPPGDAPNGKQDGNF